MILFPAIDLKDGACVRLVKGDMAQATTFNTDPVAQAKEFENLGCEWIHIVDLNGAFEGRPVNDTVVKQIVSDVSLPIQLGGGIRDINLVEAWISLGIKRIVIGTAAVKNPELVNEACRLFPGRVAVGLDAKGGKVAVEGWAEETELTVLEMAKRFEGAGVAAIIFTDIDRDGVMTGPNIAATVALANAISIPVVASGGVSSLDDVQALVDAKCPGIEGVISGRAIYDGRLDVQAAVELLRGRMEC